MKTRSTSIPVEPENMHPQQENAALIELPQWMRDALSHQPAPSPPQQAGTSMSPRTVNPRIFEC
jgi:hypothetical protein